MKTLFLAFMALLTVSTVNGQPSTGLKISDMPTYTGSLSNVWVPAISGGLNRKIEASYFAADRVPLLRTITINGVTQSLSDNRSWTISTIPTQTGNSGKWLTTDGTNASWATLSGNISLFTNNVGYLTAELDPLVASHIKSITTANIANWNNAYGWGNHASAGYATASNSMTFTNKAGNISQWTNDAGYALSANTVNLTGDQTAAGNKTWTGQTVFSSTIPSTTWRTTDNVSAGLARTITYNKFSGTNQVQQAGASFSNAARLSATTSKINCPLTGVSGSSAWTISFWLYLSEAVNQKQYFSVGTSGGGAVTLNTYLSSGSHVLNLRTDPAGVAITSATLSNNSWVHIAVVYNGSNSVTGFVNGVQQLTRTLTGGAQFSTGIELGSSVAYPTYSASTNARYDQVLVYNAALTASQISTDLYVGGLGNATPITTNLVRQWQFNDGDFTGGTAVETSGVSGGPYNATITNGAIVATGIVPQAGSNTTIEYMQVKDPTIANGEAGEVIWGASNSGTKIIGKSVRLGIGNTLFPFWITNNANIIVNPSNDGSYPGNGNNTFTLQGNMSIGMTAAAPSSGLAVSGNTLLGTSTDNLTDKLQVSGNIAIVNAGGKIKVATGTNASVGTATLVAGTVTVNTTAVAAGSLIFVSRNTPGGTTGSLSAPSASIVAGTSFVINSSSNTETSTVNWWIVN